MGALVIATTRGALFRGTTTDAIGDEVDDNSTPIEYTDWVQQRENLAFDPMAVNAASNVGWEQGGGGSAFPGSGPAGVVTDFPDVVTAARVTRTVSGSPLRLACRARLQRNAFHRIAIRVRASQAFAGVTVGLRPATTSGTNAVVLGIISIPAGISDLAFSGSTLDTPYTTQGGLTFTFSAGSIGSTLDATLADIETTSDPLGPYFDGSFSNTDLARYRFTGAEFASTSIFETREIESGFADFPISIIEAKRTEFDEASNAWRTVRYYAGRVGWKVPVEAGDRIRDNRTGEFYVVDEVERTARGISGRSSVTLTMRRTAP